ncbi:MAG: hypothetical protein HN348_24395, partial [Proteobacteria bacterium]|nr:hypothetical protein [Pseudomonadota bacterium]
NELRDIAPFAHDHGCATQLVTLSGIVSSPPQAIHLPQTKWVKALVVAIVEVPRGSPLSYAPKTSPPTV